MDEKYLTLLVFIILGLMNMWTPFIAFTAKWRNMAQGTATNITPATIWFHRLTGVLIIIMAIYFWFQN